MRSEQTSSLRPQSSARPSLGPSWPLCYLGPDSVSSCLSCERAHSPILPPDLVRIDDKSHGGSALEKTLTHRNRSGFIKETTYPQSKGLTGPTGDSIRQEASGQMLEGQTLPKILTFSQDFGFLRDQNVVAFQNLQATL